MKKIGALALAMTLAGTLSTGALATGSGPLIAPNPNVGYTTSITVNGTKLDTSSLPAAQGIPMRLVAESDYGSASWYEDEGTGAFYLDGCYVTVTFATGAVAVNEKTLEGVTAEVQDGVTFLPADLFEGLEGYTLKQGEGTVEITTPNSDPLVQLGYQIIEDSQAAARTKGTGEGLTPYGFDLANFENVVGFFSFNVTPDTVLVGKLAADADVDAVKAELEGYRKVQEETFSWYLPQNLPKVENAKILVEDGYVLLLIAEDADKGVETFRNWVKAQ